jgi:hypothetical protein
VPEPTRPTGDAEPSTLLSGTERDLLDQLQAELAAGDRRPRPYRRAGRNGRTVNGHDDGVNGHDAGPPDLAG